MAVAMKLSDELVEDAKPYAAAEHRSVPRQIEYWARIGKAVIDNPDMELFETFGNSLKEKIQATPEWRARNGGQPVSKPAPSGSGFDDMDDDIPF